LLPLGVRYYKMSPRRLRKTSFLAKSGNLVS